MNNNNSIYYYVTPLTPYLICNHYISHEIHRPENKPFRLSYNLNSNSSQDSRKFNKKSRDLVLWDKKKNNFNQSAPDWSSLLQKHDKMPTIWVKVNLPIKANDLIKNKNYNNIKNYDIIQIQVNLFDFFYYEVLPFLNMKHIKVIIITSQEHMPQLQRNSKTDNLLNNSSILLWISQNPIYTNNEKYMAFPYGLSHHTVNEYGNFIHSNNINIDKQNKIINQRSNPHYHLPHNHIRKTYDIFGKNSGESLNYNDFLTNILNNEFVISTTGDRDDCHRHYECIGLNAIPISNINHNYKDIFEDNMIYSNAEEMVEMVNNNIVQYNYKKPNINIVTISYWMNKINNKIQLIRPSAQVNNVNNLKIMKFQG